MGIDGNSAEAQRIRDLADKHPGYMDDLIHALYLEGVARRAGGPQGNPSMTEGSVWCADQFRHGFNQPDAWPELELRVTRDVARRLGLGEIHHRD